MRKKGRKEGRGRRRFPPVDQDLGLETPRAIPMTLKELEQMERVRNLRHGRSERRFVLGVWAFAVLAVHGVLVLVAVTRPELTPDYAWRALPWVDVPTLAGIVFLGRWRGHGH